jgi:hypothetical protein
MTGDQQFWQKDPCPPPSCPICSHPSKKVVMVPVIEDGVTKHMGIPEASWLRLLAWADRLRMIEDQAKRARRFKRSKMEYRNGRLYQRTKR